MRSAAGVDGCAHRGDGGLSFDRIVVVLNQFGHVFVDVVHVMPADDFWETYALASAMPRPSGPIFLTSLGWQTAGLVGVVATVCSSPNGVRVSVTGQISTRLWTMTGGGHA